MDRFHVQGVAQDKRNLLGGAQVGEPVPGEHALTSNYQVVTKVSDGLQKSSGMGRDVCLADDRAGLVEDADGQSPGVQIDAAVKSVLLVVETHHALLGLGGGLSPHRGWQARPSCNF